MDAEQGAIEEQDEDEAFVLANWDQISSGIGSLLKRILHEPG